MLIRQEVCRPPREIQEARNAIKIYDRLQQLDPGRESDLLSAHEIMMLGLVDFPGRYRSGGDEIIVESMVHAHQQEYYNALAQSTEMTDSIHARHDQRSP